MIAAAVSALAAVGILAVGVWLGHGLGYLQAERDMAEEARLTWRQIGGQR